MSGIKVTVINVQDIRKIQILLHVSNKRPGNFGNFENFYKRGDSKNLSWADQRPYEKLQCPGRLLQTRE